MLSWGGTRSNVQVTRPGVRINTNFSWEVHDVLVSRQHELLVRGARRPRAFREWDQGPVALQVLCGFPDAPTPQSSPAYFSRFPHSRKSIP